MIGNVIKKTLVNTVLVLSAGLLFFLASECAVRFVWTDWKEAYDQRAHFEYQPPKDTQALGAFRGGLPGSKGPDVFRVIVLGDSIAWGDKIRRDQDVWPQVLEDALSQQSAQNTTIEVINLAHSGFTTVNERELLERLGWRLTPDLIVLQYCLNDSLPSGADFARVGEEWIYQRSNLIPKESLHASFERHIYFYSFLNDRFKRWQKMRSGKDYHYLYREDFAGWQECKAALAAIAKSARGHNTPALLTIFPSLEEGRHTHSTYKYNAIHDKVTSVARSCGFHVLDLLEEFIRQGKDFRSWQAMPLDAHPNEAAHRVVAEAIARELLRLGLVPHRG